MKLGRSSSTPRPVCSPKPACQCIGFTRGRCADDAREAQQRVCPKGQDRGRCLARRRRRGKQPGGAGLRRLLPGKRLLTLVGIGGIGKTRLALQVAGEVMDVYRDGVRLVEFGSINDPLLVPTSVAQVLGVQERARTPLTDALHAHLKARQLLLILDNCEHLLDGCATLAAAVLRGAADTTILATSREPLHVAGEQTYPLQTLSLAEPSANAEIIARAEAVQLFVERAQRQLPDFALTAVRAPVPRRRTPATARRRCQDGRRGGVPAGARGMIVRLSGSRDWASRKIGLVAGGADT